MCGGTDILDRFDLTYTGLSPRVRGNHPWFCVDCEERRSIPACAGEPRGIWLRRLRFRVYPRVCGGT